MLLYMYTSATIQLLIFMTKADDIVCPHVSFGYTQILYCK